MALTDDVRQWFKAGTGKGASHMIVACNTVNYEDYPVYIMPEEDSRKKMAEYSGKNMQRVMEIYNLAEDMEKQIAEHMAWRRKWESVQRTLD